MDCCGIPILNFIYGERKYITAVIKSSIDQAFAITTAKYELQKVDGEHIADGNCDIVDKNGTKEISALIEPPAIGTYVLYFTYTIPPEIYKRRVTIHVN